MSGWRVALLLVCAVGLMGCAGYRLGSSLPPDIKTVYVPTFENQTGEPLLETEVTRAVIQEFQRDGTLTCVTREDADIHVAGVLRRFDLNPLAYDDETRRAANEYRMHVYASIVVTHGDSEQVLLRANNVEGRDDFVLAGDLGSAKRDNLPQVARDLARQVVGRVVEFW
jgi:hypothetical protein